jgi:poly(glycerol-phosphate) alpha-glucosyltransferase
MVAGRYSRRTDTPYVITPHGMLDPWAVNHSGWKKEAVGWLFEDRNMGRASCLHALCEREMKAIRTYGLETPVCVVPNAVDLPDLANSSEDFASEDRKTLLFLGRIHPKKGLAELIEAWAGLPHEKRREWKVAIVGWDDGGFEGQLKEKVKEKGIQEDVSFLGPRFGAEKNEVYRQADAFVLPSHGEGLPMTVLEAWSYRLPVLMTPECNLEIGFERQAALRTDPNSSSLKTGLRRLFGLSEAERRNMAMRGRKLVEEKYTWERIAEKTSRVYRWILHGENSPETLSVR